MQSETDYIKMLSALSDLANKWNDIVEQYEGDGAYLITAHVSPYTGLVSRFTIGYDVE